MGCGATTRPGRAGLLATGMITMDNREDLSFQDDTGASRSTWIAAALVVAIVGWMGSGYILPSKDTGAPQASDKEVEPVAVAVDQSMAVPVTLYFQAEGQALPDRDTSIRAEASGDVAEVLVSKGEDVGAGAVIARLSATRAEASGARRGHGRPRQSGARHACLRASSCHLG